jgi:hypothetical protein
MAVTCANTNGIEIKHANAVQAKRVPVKGVRMVMLTETDFEQVPCTAENGTAKGSGEK